MNKIIIEIPQEVYNRLEVFITETIRKAIEKHAAEIQSKPRKLTRAEAAKKLRVSLPTIDSYVKNGLLNPERIGRRILFSEDNIEQFLKTTRK